MEKFFSSTDDEQQVTPAIDRELDVISTSIEYLGKYIYLTNFITKRDEEVTDIIGREVDQYKLLCFFYHENPPLPTKMYSRRHGYSTYEEFPVKYEYELVDKKIRTKYIGGVCRPVIKRQDDGFLVTLRGYLFVN